MDWQWPHVMQAVNLHGRFNQTRERLAIELRKCRDRICNLRLLHIGNTDTDRRLSKIIM